MLTLMSEAFTPARLMSRSAARSCRWSGTSILRVKRGFCCSASIRRHTNRHQADLVDAHILETPTYYGFPREHRRRLRTNNPLERIMREIRRRTRVVGAFPDGSSALMLCAARLRHIAGTTWGTRRYLNLDVLHQQDLEDQERAAS